MLGHITTGVKPSLPAAAQGWEPSRAAPWLCRAHCSKPPTPLQRPPGAWALSHSQGEAGSSGAHRSPGQWAMSSSDVSNDDAPCRVGRQGKRHLPARLCTAQESQHPACCQACSNTNSTSMHPATPAALLTTSCRRMECVDVLAAAGLKLATELMPIDSYTALASSSILDSCNVDAATTLYNKETRTSELCISEGAAAIRPHAEEAKGSPTVSCWQRNQASAQDVHSVWYGGINAAVVFLAAIACSSGMHAAHLLL